MKKSKKIKRYLILIPIVLIILIVLSIFIYNFQEMSLSAFSEKTKSVTWGNVQIEMKAPYFGLLKSSSPELGTILGVPSNICGTDASTDNTISILNNNFINSDGSLTLTSAMTGGTGCAGNYLKGSLIFPEGILKGKCVTKASIRESQAGGNSYASCKLEGTSYIKVKACDPNIANCKESINQEDSFEVSFPSTTILSFELLDNIADGGGESESNLELEFIRTSVPEPTPKEECGNDILEGNEECDDGNLINNDGCSSNCLIEIVEEYCGDGICKYPETSYTCSQDCSDTKPEPEPEPEPERPFFSTANIIAWIIFISVVLLLIIILVWRIRT